MQSRTSCFNKTILKKNILHFWPVWALYTFFLMACVPFSIWITTQSKAGLSAKEAELVTENNLLHYVDILDFSMSAVWTFGIALICAMAVFHYMYSSKSIYMMHSFPVNRTQLYVTNLVSGFLFMAVPQCLTFLVTAFVCLGRDISKLEYLLYWLLMVLGMSLFAYSLAVFLGMLTGQFFVLPIFFALANYLYIGLQSVLKTFIGQLTYGLQRYRNLEIGSIFSPLHWLSVNARIEWDDEIASHISISGQKAVAAYAAAGIFLIFAGWFVYQKRQLETVGDFITMKWLKPIFRWGSAVSFSCLAVVIVSWLMRYNLRVKGLLVILLCAALSAAVFFFIAQMLLEKQFKIFHKNRVIEGACAAALMAAFVCLVDMDVLGLEREMPKTQEVKTAFLYMDYPVEGDQTEEIEEIKKLHKQILDSKKELENCFYKNKKTDFTNLNIKYYCKDGSTIERNYEIPITKEYREDENSILNRIQKQEGLYENQMAYIFGKNYETIDLMNISLNLYNTVTETYEEVSVESKYTEKFYQALQKDIREGNLKNGIGIQTDSGAESSVTMTMQYYNSEGIDDIQNRWATGQSDEWMQEWKSSSASVDFTDQCAHLMKVLEEADVLGETYKILTEEEIDSREQ